MKKSLKKVLCLCMCLLLSFAVPVSAQTPSELDYPVAPCYSYVSEIDLSLDISDSGLASFGTSVLLSNSNHSCTLKMVLQRENGSGWDNVKSWNFSGGMDLIAEKIWYVVPGYDYRIQSTVKVYNANERLIETITEESVVIFY